MDSTCQCGKIAPLRVNVNLLLTRMRALKLKWLILFVRHGAEAVWSDTWWVWAAVAIEGWGVARRG